MAHVVASGVAKGRRVCVVAHRAEFVRQIVDNPGLARVFQQYDVARLALALKPETYGQLLTSAKAKASELKATPAFEKRPPFELHREAWRRVCTPSESTHQIRGEP
jgi:hypothetical protein